jgi:hypothetical protein
MALGDQQFGAPRSLDRQWIESVDSSSDHVETWARRMKAY